MRLATRTALASLVASSVTLVIVGAVFRDQFARGLQDRVDAQLEERTDTAPILVAVADRLARSELQGAVEGTRVAIDGRIIPFGSLPDDPLPDVDDVGWTTVSADGERWRLLTVEVLDVPEVGDSALVQLVAPLGDVDENSARLRRHALIVFGLTTLAAGALGFLLGRRATRPLSVLRRDSEAVDLDDPESWCVAQSYGSPEVDDVAATLNENLRRLAEATRRRNSALDSARAFAASATHEIRTPLQGALMNLDIARSSRATETDRTESLRLASAQLHRIATALAAVGALSDAETVDSARFEAFPVSDLVDQADAAIAEERRRRPGATIELEAPETSADLVVAWSDGLRLAIANLVRNALVHGVPTNDVPALVRVAVASTSVTVDDNGPGVPVGDRQRMLERFEKGDGDGSGLGLAIVHQVALAHGGIVEIGSSPLGGTRVVMTFGHPPADLLDGS